jgi:hypothetical protein
MQRANSEEFALLFAVARWKTAITPRPYLGEDAVSQ